MQARTELAVLLELLGKPVTIRHDPTDHLPWSLSIVGDLYETHAIDWDTMLEGLRDFLGECIHG